MVRLSLEKSVAYKILKEKTIYGIIKALSDIYEKHLTSNKVFLIMSLVKTKMKDASSMKDHVNKFNSIILRLVSIDIKFNN